MKKEGHVAGAMIWYEKPRMENGPSGAAVIFVHEGYVLFQPVRTNALFLPVVCVGTMLAHEMLVLHGLGCGVVPIGI